MNREKNNLELLNSIKTVNMNTWGFREKADK